MENKNDLRKFHYTIGNYLPKIIRDEKIKCSCLGHPEQLRHYAVWVSTNQLWEETACKSWYDIHGNRCKGFRQRTHELYGGLKRIEVKPDAAPYDWKTFVRKSRISNTLRRLLVRNGRDVGAEPSQWFVNYAPINKKDWINIEQFDWDEQTWKPYLVVAEEPKQENVKAA